jgi:hypothetical protein
MPTKIMAKICLSIQTFLNNFEYVFIGTVYFAQCSNWSVGRAALKKFLFFCRKKMKEW